MRERKRKPSAASLKNLVPGGNLRHGAFRFLRTGEISAEDKDIATEAKRLRKQLIETYCQPGNFLLEEVQSRTIGRLISSFIFSEILWTHLWAEAVRARGDEIQKTLTSSGWAVYLAADRKMFRAFRELIRNLKDFG